MKTLVIGLGNPILTDDGAGIHAARVVAEALPADSGVDVVELSVGGLALMEAMIGCEQVIIIDALYADVGDAGRVHVFDAGDLMPTLNTASTHDADLPTALRVGRKLGADLPDDSHIRIVGITAHDVLSFGEVPSPPVMAAVPNAADAVLRLLGCSMLSRTPAS